MRLEWIIYYCAVLNLVVHKLKGASTAQSHIIEVKKCSVSPIELISMNDMPLESAFRAQ